MVQRTKTPRVNSQVIHAERKRLAQLYVRTAKGVEDYKNDAAARKSTAAYFARLKVRARKSAAAYFKLSSGIGETPLVRSARGRYGDEMSLAQLLAYRVELEFNAIQCEKLAADFERAEHTLRRRPGPGPGNKSKIAMRHLIYNAATSYQTIHNLAPGRSRSDPGPFGQYVASILLEIPEKSRPKPPAPSAIDDVLKLWFERHPVAVRSGG